MLEEVRTHPDRTIELTHAASDALLNGAEERLSELDTQTELEVGKKERALGALRQHRNEHGC